jgi:hypothetical protein
MPGAPQEIGGVQTRESCTDDHDRACWSGPALRAGFSGHGAGNRGESGES